MYTRGDTPQRSWRAHLDHQKDVEDVEALLH
jgi:hypothetical protein